MLSRRQKNSLLWAYRGAGLPDDIGSTAAIGASTNPAIANQARVMQQQQKQRGDLLANAIKAGTIKPQQLSAQDLQLVRPNLNKGQFSGGFLSDVGDLLGNYGNDAWMAAKGIPGGIVDTTKAIAGDLGMSFLGAGATISPSAYSKRFQAAEEPAGSRVKHEVIDPAVASYKYMYGGVGAPKGSTFFERFAQHPLGPTLDALTVASLGAGGAIRGAGWASRTGAPLSDTRVVQGLARAGRTDTRAPVILNPSDQERAGVTFPSVPRRYSSRPLMKLGQIGYDALANRIRPLGEMRTNQTVKRLQRYEHAKGLAAEAAAVRAAVTPLVGSRKDLSVNEATALDYALRGWNTPEKIEASRQMFKDSLAERLPEGSNIRDFEGLFKTPQDAYDFVEYKANLPEEVERLILNPTEAMINAAQATHEAVQEGFEKLGLSAEEIQARVTESQRILDDYMGWKPDDGTGGVDPNHPVGPDPDAPRPVFGGGLAADFNQLGGGLIEPLSDAKKMFKEDSPELEANLQSGDDVAIASAMDNIHAQRRPAQNQAIWDDSPEVAEQAAIDTSRTIKRDQYPDTESFIEAWMDHYEERAAGGSSWPDSVPEPSTWEDMTPEERLGWEADNMDAIPELNDQPSSGFSRGQDQATIDGIAQNLEDRFGEDVDTAYDKLEITSEVLRQAFPNTHFPDSEVQEIHSYLWEPPEVGGEIQYSDWGTYVGSIMAEARSIHPELRGEAPNTPGNSVMDDWAKGQGFEGWDQLNQDILKGLHNPNIPYLPEVPDTPEGFFDIWAGKKPEEPEWGNQISDEDQSRLDAMGGDAFGRPGELDNLEQDANRAREDDQPEGFYIRRARDEQAMSQFGVLWNELTREQKVEVDANIIGIPDELQVHPQIPDTLGDMMSEFDQADDDFLRESKNNAAQDIWGKEYDDLDPDERDFVDNIYQKANEPVDDIPETGGPDSISGSAFLKWLDGKGLTDEDIGNLSDEEWQNLMDEFELEGPGFGDRSLLGDSEGDENPWGVPDTSEYTQRSDEANARVEEPASQSFQDFYNDLEANERFVDDETVEWPDEAYTEDGMNDEWFDNTDDPEGVAYEAQWAPALEQQEPGMPGIDHTDEFDSGPMASEVEELVGGLFGQVPEGHSFEPKSQRNITVVFRDENGQPGAIAQFTTNPDYSLEDTWGKYDGIYVRPDLRQQGIASQMMEYIKDTFNLDLADFIRNDRQFTQKGAHFAWGYDAKRKGVNGFDQATGAQFEGTPNIPDTPNDFSAQDLINQLPEEFWTMKGDDPAYKEMFDNLHPDIQQYLRDHGIGPEEWQDFGGTPNTPDEPPPTDFEPPTPDGEPDYPIQPTYVPNIPAAGFQKQEPGRIARMFGEPETVFTRGKYKSTGVNSALGITTENLFSKAPESYLREQPDVLKSGAARFDPKAFVESVARREKDIVSQGFNQDLLGKLSAKGEDGEPLKFNSQDDVKRRLGPEWVLVHEQFPIQWFNAETNFANELVENLEQLRLQGLSSHDPQVEKLLENIADRNAQTFVHNAFNAQRLEGVAIPKEFFNYQRRLVTAMDPFDNKFGRGYARYMHRWRALTLAYMPRWAVNTAIGSFFLNMVKGVTPRDYMLARKLHKQGVFGEPRLGGVELGSVTGMEYLEPAALGHLDRSTGISVTPVGERIVEKVQQIEDHFRRASFIHSLDKVSQRRMADMGQIISNLERRRMSVYDTRAPWSPRADDDMLEAMLSNPDVVQEAIDDLNTFAYNFAALGPYERRYVRMAVPFWGWYKFISKVAYRLPVEYPGRTNILANLGMLGMGHEEELGPRPDWLYGIIPLSMDKGRLSYLSTMGQNPFGSFINPFSKQGGVEGTISLGQASPPVQALLSAFGLDPLRGGEVPISPKQGVAPDYFGSLIDTVNGRETNPAQQAGVRRFIMGLLRSAPQVRMGEQYLAQGRSVYPESIPFIDQRPMPTDPRDTSMLANLGQIFGVAPKTYNLEGYQKGIKKRVKYAKSRNKTALKKQRKSDKKAAKK